MMVQIISSYIFIILVAVLFAIGPALADMVVNFFAAMGQLFSG